MENKFHLDILTPSKVIYDGDVLSVIVPAYKGEMGILAHHEPFLACIKEGDIKVRDVSGKNSAFKVSGAGFLKVRENKAVILLDPEKN